MVTIDSLAGLLNASQPVLGLDAYGVLYNDRGLFDTIPDVFRYCNDHQIPIYMVTNNSTQSIPEISRKMSMLGVSLPEDRIISSGCGCYLLPELASKLAKQPVYVYGYPACRYYVEQAQGTVVEDPNDANVIVFAASQSTNNHLMYRAVHDALKLRPDMPVICINPDHYVRNAAGFMRVMGYYAHQMQLQLGRDDWIWMGKPFSIFSDLVRQVLIRDGHDPSQLIFCDDNPLNVRQLSHDLNCRGVVITKTGIFDRYSSNLPSDLVQMPVCKIN